MPIYGQKMHFVDTLFNNKTIILLDLVEHHLIFAHLTYCLVVQICPGMHANEIQALYNKHHKVSSHIKMNQNTHDSRAANNFFTLKGHVSDLGTILV